MITTVLTDHFKKLRIKNQTAYLTEEFGNDLIISLDEPTLSPPPPPPDWLSQVNSIEEKMGDIQYSMESLHELMAALPSIEGNTANKSEIDQKSTLLTVDFQKCGKSIEMLGSSVQERTEEESLRNNIKRRLAGQLQKMTSDYRQMQGEYSQTIRPLVEEDEDDIDRPSWIGTTSNTVEAPLDYRIVTEKNIQIKQIHKTMVELRELFTNLSKLVVIQGTILDRIDENLATANATMAVGIIEIKKTKEIQKTTTKCWIGLLVFVLLFAIAIIVVIKIRRG